MMASSIEVDQRGGNINTSDSDLSDSSIKAKNSSLLQWLKLIFCLFVAFVFTVSLSVGQLSMFHLTMTFGEISNSGKNVSNGSTYLKGDFNNNARIEANKIFNIIVIGIITPYVITLIRATLRTWGRSDMLSPTWKMIGWGVLASVLEGGGVSFLAIKVFPLYNGVANSLLICTISTFSTISAFIIQLIRRIRMGQSGLNASRNRIEGWRIAISLGAGMMELIGGGFMFFWTIDTTYALRYVRPIIALIILYFAWLPVISRKSVQFEEKRSTRKDYFQKSEAAWKMSLLSNVVKIIVVIVVSFCLYLFDHSLYTIDELRTDFWEEYTISWRVWTWSYDEKAYVLLIVSCTVAHELGLFLCRISTSMSMFLFPGYLSNLVIMIFLWNNDICTYFLKESTAVCTETLKPEWAIVSSTILFAAAALMLIFVFSFRKKHILLRKEAQIVWLPSFSTVAPGVWSILNKRMWPWDLEQDKPVQEHQEAQIFICTTMYRESKKEMKELLRSFNSLSSSSTPHERERQRYVFHIVFDDGARGDNLTKFALQLLTLMDETLGISVSEFKKITQPYGVKLSWDGDGKFKFPLSIHFKDTSKVKKKKRWSQVMYMKEVMKAIRRGFEEENIIEGEIDVQPGVNRYILTTDADVAFTKESLETLVDLMTRDKTVGAVTGRTHPAGHGPTVWYQVFEYAIGHWLQKTAEHHLGSVLCAPGCFSLFRCEALKEIQEEYSTDVSCGFDFLTKDMGEDRWLCTLLIQKGWTIEYCAVSNNETHCPDSFNELYKQRRRWVVSTIANMILLMKNYKKLTSSKRKQLSFAFLIFQGISLCSTFIAPSTVIMVVAGGLSFAWNVSPLITIISQVLVALLFTFVCLSKNLTSKHQLTVARWFSLLYCVVMAAVLVGTIKSVVGEFDSMHDSGKSGPQLDLSASTLYILFLVAVFSVTSVLHKDIIAVFYGVFYFLCIPSAYLLLIIYSLCNITDRSWGTREEKEPKGTERSLLQLFWKAFRDNGASIVYALQACICNRTRPDPVPLVIPPLVDVTATIIDELDTKDVKIDTQQNLTDWLEVSTWLEYQDSKLVQYASVLRDNGYEDVRFLAHLDSVSLQVIGIVKLHDRQALLAAAESLSDVKVPSDIPDSVQAWLNEIGLQNYDPGNLSKESLSDKDILAERIAEKLGIQKPGHIARLKYALQCVRHPSKDEQANNRVRDELAVCEVPRISEDEYSFWEDCLKNCLSPDTAETTNTKDLKAELVRLRNYWLQIMALSNTLWLIFIVTLASHSELAVMGVNALGWMLLLIYSLVLLIQFCTMIFHRISTLIHILARVSTSDMHCCCKRNKRTRNISARGDETVPKQMILTAGAHLSVSSEDEASPLLQEN